MFSVVTNEGGGQKDLLRAISVTVVSGGRVKVKTTLVLALN
jgi:hypothetical protein